MQLSLSANRHAFASVSPASVALIAGLAFVGFIFLTGPPFRLEQYDAPKDIAFGVMGAVCALLLMRSANPPADQIEVALFLFVGWGALIVPVLAVNDALAWRTLGLFCAAVSVFLLARRAGNVGAPEIYWAVIAVLFGVSVLVLLESYGAIPYISAPGLRPGATLGNRNLAARLACFALPLLWNRLYASDHRVLRFASLTVLCSVVAVIVLSRSRAAFVVASAMTMLVPLIARRGALGALHRRWRTSVLQWMTAVAIGGAVAVVLPNRMGWSKADFASSVRRVAEYQRGTGRGRVIQTETTWRMIRENVPWGVGPGNWSVVYPGYALAGDPSVLRTAFYPGPQTPRSDLLPMLAEWGLVGCAVGIAFLVLLAMRTASLLLLTNERARSAGALIVCLSLTAAMLSMFDSVLRVAPTIVVLSLSIGLALGEGEAEGQLERVHPGCVPQGLRSAILGLYSMASFALARSAGQDVSALRVINSFASVKDLARAAQVAPNNVEALGLLSLVLVQAGRCDLAAAHLSRAARLQPFSSLVSALHAKCASAKWRSSGPGGPDERAANRWPPETS